MNLFTKQKQTLRLRELTYGSRWESGSGWGERVVREFGMDMYILLYLKWIPNKDLLSGTGNSVQRHAAAWMGGEFRREWTQVCGWLSTWNYHTLLISHAAAAAESLQSCPTLCDPIDGSPPGSPVPGTLQARTLEWVAISFSNAWK